MADLLPALADRLKLAEKNQRKISFTSEEMKSIQQNASAARTHAKDGMKRHSLGHVVDAITKALEDSEGIGSIPATERLYQFKITLLEVTPPIWRRIQVRNCTLDKLHDRPQRHDGFFEADSDVQWLHSPLSWVEMTMPEETEAGSAGKQPAKGLMRFSRHCFKPPTSALNGSCLTDTHRRKVGNYWAVELPCLPDSINRESQPEANRVLRTVWAIRMPI